MKIIRRKIRNIITKYWYNNTKVKTGLDKGFYDKDTLMLHACFSLLKDFVELELVPFTKYHSDSVDLSPEEALDRVIKESTEYGNQAETKIYEEIKVLYFWWESRRFLPGLDLCDIDFSVDPCWSYDRDDSMLKRLIDVRRALWT